ncbi:hypothetical protein ACFL2V_18235 [Pseudomonadota bacterium]
MFNGKLALVKVGGKRFVYLVCSVIVKKPSRMSNLSAVCLGLPRTQRLSRETSNQRCSVIWGSGVLYKSIIKSGLSTNEGKANHSNKFDISWMPEFVVRNIIYLASINRCIPQEATVYSMINDELYTLKSQVFNFEQALSVQTSRPDPIRMLSEFGFFP